MVERYIERTLFENIPLRAFYLRPIAIRHSSRLRSRDVGKHHGGSAQIEFEWGVDYQLVMDRIRHYEELEENDHCGVKGGGIGRLKFSWMESPSNSTSREQEFMDASEKEEENEEEEEEQQQLLVDPSRLWCRDKKNDGVTKEITLSRAKVSSKSGMDQKDDRQQHRKQRAEKYSRQRMKRGLETDQILNDLKAFWSAEDDSLNNDHDDPSWNRNNKSVIADVLNAPELDWHSVPFAIDPVRGGGLRFGSLRGSRKQAQVEAILYVVRVLLHEQTSRYCNHQIVVADLASGAGNLSLPLAWFLQKNGMNAKVLAVDINPRALERLQSRAEDSGVVVETLAEDLEHFTRRAVDDGLHGDCHIIVSLHACGAASDLAIEAAVSRGLPFVVSPCCIGKANHVRQSNDQTTSGNSHNHDWSNPLVSSSQRSGAPDRITYPRSKQLNTLCLEKSVLNDYPLVLTAADYSIGGGGGEQGQSIIHLQRGRISKRVVEMDRLKWAEEKGYYTRLLEIPRLGLYPKKELLLGAKQGSEAAKRLSRLPVVTPTTSTQLFARNVRDHDHNHHDDSPGNICDDTSIAKEKEQKPNNDMNAMPLR